MPPEAGKRRAPIRGDDVAIERLKATARDLETAVIRNVSDANARGKPIKLINSAMAVAVAAIRA
jgi:hypothetical protein